MSLTRYLLSDMKVSQSIFLVEWRKRGEMCPWLALAVSRPSIAEFPALECWPFGPSHFSGLETLFVWMISDIPPQETLWCHNSTADLLLVGQMVVSETLYKAKGHFTSIPSLYGSGSHWAGFCCRVTRADGHYKHHLVAGKIYAHHRALYSTVWCKKIISCLNFPPSSQPLTWGCRCTAYQPCVTVFRFFLLNPVILWLNLSSLLGCK